MKYPIYQVDAFTDRVFGGNPAAVVPLEGPWPPDETLQAIALENNLSETAFVRPRPDGYDLRWFTPGAEVDLCGHATLATAHVLFEGAESGAEELVFHTQSGPLQVRRRRDLLELNFPARPGLVIPQPGGLSAALGALPEACFRSRDLMAVFADESALRALRPNFPALLQQDYLGIIVTAPGDNCDFVSRFFAPAVGVDEDPVTGSAHCTLIPYWAERLGKTSMEARQISAREGRLICEVHGERVTMAGHAVSYMRGEITVP